MRIPRRIFHQEDEASNSAAAFGAFPRRGLQPSYPAHKMKKLLIVDALSQAYRAFHAIPPLSTSTGIPTNAVQGFASMLAKGLEDHRPDYLAIAGDAGGKNFRHRAYPEYKATRKPMPPELREQIPLIKDVVRGLRIPWLEVAGYEADDIIATLVRRARESGLETVVLSADKDLLQLVGEGVCVASPHREEEPYDPEGVRERYGVRPERLADFLALTGDASDNIPGIPKVGKKTAAALLEEYGDLEGVLAHAEEVSGNVLRENLLRYADQARRARVLVGLKDDVPLSVEIGDLVRKEPDPEVLGPLYRRLELKGLARKLDTGAAEECVWEEVESPRAVAALAAELAEGGTFSFSCRARPEGGVSALAFAAGDRVAVVELNADAFRSRKLEALAPLFTAPGLRRSVHDGKAAVHLLESEGIAPGPLQFDTLLASYLLRPARPEHSLETLCWEYLDWKLDSGDPGSSGFLGRQARAVERLRAELLPELEEKKLLSLLLDLELPVSRVLAAMEDTGVAVDRARLKLLSVEFGEKLDELSARMYDLAGETFNLNSPVQLRRVLFDKLGLAPAKKTKTGYSTDVGVLEKLAEDHELPRLLLEYRQYFKLKSTYVDALPALIAADGRVHTTFHQAVTATGRISSSNPNLQNIPVRSEEGRRIREAFRARAADWTLVAADYSQIELRLLAHLSDESRMIEAFEQGLDIHAFTASLIFGVPIGRVSPDERRRAKTVNFGIIYGMGASRLSRELGISRGEAEDFIRAYFERYPGVKSYYDRVIAEACRSGYVSTIFHRRRYLPELKSQRPMERAFGERAAMNAPIQGSAADIIKKAMVELFRRIRDDGAAWKMLLQIHDELLLECPRSETVAAARVIRDCMEKVVSLRVPILVDFKTGSTWGEMAAYRVEG
ncbi:MAG TPA: DNA polymerase I [bacterium]|nr:DNA polymerase I [bacterium]